VDLVIRCWGSANQANK